MLNDEFLAGLLRLVPSHLPLSHSLQRMRLCFAAAVLIRSVQFLKTNISPGSVATRLRCRGIFDDFFILKFLLSVFVKEF